MKTIMIISLFTMFTGACDDPTEAAREAILEDFALEVPDEHVEVVEDLKQGSDVQGKILDREPQCAWTKGVDQGNGTTTCSRKCDNKTGLSCVHVHVTNETTCTDNAGNSHTTPGNPCG